MLPAKRSRINMARLATYAVLSCVCAHAATARELSPTQIIRQLALDLYGRVPTAEELSAAQSDVAIDETTIRDWVQRDETAAFYRRYHADLLWPAFDPFSLVSYFAAGLLPSGFYEVGGDPGRFFLLSTSLYTRGALVPCKDEPAELDATGYPLLEPWPDGTLRDGWVWVEPYWAPGTQVKVCALEARDAAWTPDGAPCSTFQAMVSGDCGCGPRLERCLSPEAAMAVEESLREQLLGAIVDPIVQSRDYYDFLSERREKVNGPLVHYYRHLAPMAVEPLVLVPPVPIEALPDIPFTDTSWHEVTRGAEHSGVLTQLLYLLRFQTSRARAARFYDAFLCSPFVAPDVALPSPSDPCTTEPDLRIRCGCSYCHASLEPASAHWGRFAEAGALYLKPTNFPAFRPSCATCAAAGACDFSCERFYFTQAGHPKEEQYLGMLKSYVFRDPADEAAIAAGPSALVAKALESGQMERCTVNRLFERLMGRSMNAGEKDELEEELVESFRASGHRFDELLIRILADARYRRLER